MLVSILRKLLRDVFGGGFDIDLASLLSRLTELSVATGDATGGSTTTLVDTSIVWEVDKWKDAVVEITHAADGKHYFVTITENTADTLTFPAIAVTVAAGDHYEIRMTLRLADIDKWGGTSLTSRDISLDLAKLGLQRWGRDLEPEWVHAAEVADSAEGAALVTKAVGAGKSGYIYGFLISAQETNDFKLNWTSGTTDYSIRIPFGGAGSTECVDPTPLNEGLPADAGTNITITNVNAAAAGKFYQARLLYAEV
ncbi:hypothetical protein ES703_108710 [subsurface metagenome]